MLKSSWLSATSIATLSALRQRYPAADLPYPAQARRPGHVALGGAVVVDLEGLALLVGDDVAIHVDLGAQAQGAHGDVVALGGHLAGAQHGA